MECTLHLFFDAPNHDKYLISLRDCVKDMKNTQVAALITKFAKEHPETSHMSPCISSELSTIRSGGTLCVDFLRF